MSDIKSKRNRTLVLGVSLSFAFLAFVYAIIKHTEAKYYREEAIKHIQDEARWRLEVEKCKAMARLAEETANKADALSDNKEAKNKK